MEITNISELDALAAVEAPALAEETNPFPDDVLAVTDYTEPSKVPATPVRTQILGLATMSRDVKTENGAYMALKEANETAQNLLDTQQEGMIRYRIAGERMIEQAANIKKLTEGIPSHLVDPALAEAVRNSLDVHYTQSIEEKAKTAAEEAAFEQIRELSGAGRTTEARLMLRQLSEDSGSTLKVLRDHALKRMLVSQMREKATASVENEGWVHYIVSSLIAIPELVFMGESFAHLGNVKEGTNGYKGAWHRFFTPGSDWSKQIEALQGMSAEEFAKHMPELEENIKSNATTFWVTNPGRIDRLTTDIDEGLTESEQTSRNLWAMADAVGLVPFGTAKKLLSIPSILTSSGSRKLAEDSVRNAIELTVREGAEVAAERTGITAAEATDEILPTIINPGRPPNFPAVSLSGDVNDGLIVAEKVIEDMRLSGTSRFTSQEELDAAMEVRATQLRAELGDAVKDVELVPQNLPDGTTTYRIRATIGNPEGGGFATRQEFVGYMQSHGFYATEGDTLIREVENIVSDIKPQDFGYTNPVYHGTDQVFDEIKPSWAGKLGPGVYVTPKAYVAADYAGPVSEKFAGNPNIRPYLINEDKLFGVRNIDGWTLPEMRKVIKELGISKERSAPFLKGVKKDGKVDSQTFTKFLQKSFNDEEVEGMLSIGEGLNRRLEELGYHGIAGDMWGDVEYAIFKPDNIRSVFDRQIIKDISEQFFGRVDVDIPETGLYTTPIRPPRQNFASKFWETTSNILDRRLFEQAARSGQKRNRLYSLIQGQLTKAYRALDKNERQWLNQILAEGDKRSVWFKPSEFNVIYERATGKLPSERVINAYKQFRLNNDMEYQLRNADVYRQKVIRGFETGEFSVMGDPIEANIKFHSMKNAPKARVYNLSDDVHYTNSDIHGSIGNLTNERLQNLEAQGYVLFRMEEALKLKDGTTVDWFVAKRNDVLRKPLKTVQLPYKAGGHRLYADKYFVKQAVYGTQPDTGKKFLKNPNVHITAPNVKIARDWADTMNAARLAVKEGKSAAYIDENIFRAQKGYPKAEQFMKDIEEGHIDMDEAFEAVFDREMPSVYNKSEDIDNFIDEDEVGFNGYYRTTGKMFTSSKGTQLKDYTGEWAPTIDPFEAQSKALNNVAQMSSFSDFKVSAIDRWYKEYKGELNIRDLPEDLAQSPVHIFNSATVKRSTPVSLRQQIEAQREAIKRILGFESDFDRGLRNFMRSTAEWIVGDSDNALRQQLSKGVYWLQDRNPIGFLRGLAFDMKLGMLNPGQLLLQSSTMISAMALSPRLGAKGIASVPFVRAYFTAQRMGKDVAENVLETITKRGGAKLSGFDDVAEFKSYVREAARSGFFDLGDTHALVNNIGPANTFGSLKGGIAGAREMGRFFFYEAEVWNRLTAWRIAYSEAVERLGRDKIGTFEFNNFLSGRAENYAFNMSNESKAAWQTGLMSIPTQFWAYNVRMIEALVGGNFTTAQKLRLAAAQMGMAGTAGLPIIAGISEMVKEHYGVKPDIESILGVADRGIADFMIKELFGADVEVSQRWGTGSWSSDLVRDIFGMSQYNEKSFADIAGGATYSILGGALGSVVEAATYWMSHESGAEDTVGLTEDEVISLAKNISTINNALKARMVWQYGVYKSQKGGVTASGLPPEDAIWIALGVPPAELTEIGIMMAYNKNRKEDIKELAREITNLRQEAVAIPSKFESNARKVNVLINMIPPELKEDVLKEAHRVTDPSLYTSLIRNHEQRLIKEGKSAE